MKKQVWLTGIALSVIGAGALITNRDATRPAYGANVMHIGHSLMEKEMPQWVKNLADEAKIPHAYSYQLIIGSPLTYQWDIGDFDEDTQKNQKGRQGVDARRALSTSKFDALVMCDATPVLTHLQWGSLDSAPKWCAHAMKANPKTRVYLYHFWPHLNAPNYSAAFEEERKAYGTIADTMAQKHKAQFPDGKVHIVPAGAAIVELKRRIENGGVPGIKSIRDIYRDDIHLTNTGMYLVALVHFATLYSKNPTGLSAQMNDQWGNKMVDLPPATAKIFQEIAWQAATNDSRSGVTK